MEYQKGLCSCKARLQETEAAGGNFRNVFLWRLSAWSGVPVNPPPFPFPFSGRTRALKVGTWHLVGNTEAWEHGSWSVCQAFQFLLLQTEAGAGLLLTCSWSVVAICGSKLQEALTIFLGLSFFSVYGQAYVPWACLSVLNSPDNFQPGCGSRRWLWKVFTGGLANDGQQENLPELGDIGLWSACASFSVSVARGKLRSVQFCLV